MRIHPQEIAVFQPKADKTEQSKQTFFYTYNEARLFSQVDNSSWSTEKNVTAAPASSGSGTEVTFDVTFEPINLGPARGNLTLTSPIGGEYSFPLEGFCDPPKPQGPFVIRNKSNVSIPFKNVFPNNQVFQCQVIFFLVVITCGNASTNYCTLQFCIDQFKACYKLSWV